MGRITRSGSGSYAGLKVKRLGGTNVAYGADEFGRGKLIYGALVGLFLSSHQFILQAESYAGGRRYIVTGNYTLCNMLNGHFIADLIGNGHGECAGFFGNRSSFGCSVGRNRLGGNSFRRSRFFAVGGRFAGTLVVQPASRPMTIIMARSRDSVFFITFLLEKYSHFDARHRF
ncbi:MAG: hypothetical protein V8Q85_01270 [Christensenellales bacterium]